MKIFISINKIYRPNRIHKYFLAEKRVKNRYSIEKQMKKI